MKHTVKLTKVSRILIQANAIIASTVNDFWLSISLPNLLWVHLKGGTNLHLNPIKSMELASTLFFNLVKNHIQDLSGGRL